MTEPEPERPERRGVRKWLSELSTTVKAVGGVAAAIAAIVGLVFLFFPDLRPDGTSDEGSATFSKPTVEQPVTFGQYLDRVEIPRDGYTEEDLQRPGALVGVQVTIKGYRDQALPLRWYLLDGPRDRRPAEPTAHPDGRPQRRPCRVVVLGSASAWSGPVQDRGADLSAEREAGRRPPRRGGDGAVRSALAECAQLEGQHEHARELAADEVRRPAAVG